MQLCFNKFSEKMGSECNSSKRPYDITMSKRTRKPSNLQEANHQNNHTTASSKWDIPLKSITSIFDQSSPRKADHEVELESDRTSLKQLISGDENAKEMSRSGRSSTSLSHHFTEEEKQLQLVKKHQQDNGVKLKGMMSRYAKVLRHLVKVKREPRIESRKKHLLRLTM